MAEDQLYWEKQDLSALSITSDGEAPVFFTITLRSTLI